MCLSTDSLPSPRNIDEYESMSLLDMNPFRIRFQEATPRAREMEEIQPIMSNFSSNSGHISVPPDGFYDFDSIQFPLFDQSENSFDSPIQSKPATVDNKNKKISFKCKVSPAKKIIRHCGQFMAERLRRSCHRRMAEYMYKNFL